MKRTDGQMTWNLYLLLKMKSDEHMAEEDQSESSDDEPMQINVQDLPAAYHFEKRREFIPPANTEIVPPNITPIVPDPSPHEYF